MKKEELRHEAYMALIDLTGGLDLLREKLTAENITASKIIEAVDVFMDDLREARKTFEGLLD